MVVRGWFRLLGAVLILCGFIGRNEIGLGTFLVRFTGDIFRANCFIAWFVA